jgi:hypothetical protein
MGNRILELSQYFMNEGWQNDVYLIILTQDESFAVMKTYRFEHYLPGYTLLGLRNWDYFIVMNAYGAIFTVPTLPLDAQCITPFTMPQQISLEPDEQFKGKIKWHVKPLVFGGDPMDETNGAWITHEQHAELVVWWNEQYWRAEAQHLSD